MPGAYDDLMKALSDYEKTGAPERDAEKERKRKAEEDAKRRAEEEAKRKEAEKQGYGGRVREGFDRMQELRDAASRELKARPYKKPEGGVNGVRG